MVFGAKAVFVDGGNVPGAILQIFSKARVIPVLTDWELPGLAINLVYTSRLHLPAKTRAFIDFIVKEFQHLD